MGFGTVARLEAEMPMGEYLERLALVSIEAQERREEIERQKKANK